MSMLSRVPAILVLSLIAPSAIVASVSDARMSTFPNTTIDYYRVEGATVTAINRSIREQRAPSGGNAVPASTSWTMTADFDRRMTDGECTVDNVRVDVAARVELPQLADGGKLTDAERKRWGDYVALLQNGSAATLAFVYSNVGQVEAAIRGSSCDNARTAASDAVRMLRAHSDRLSVQNEKRLATLNEFRPSMLADSKLICRDLRVTGGRLQTVRTCLPAREWERLWKSSAEYTQQVVEKFSKSSRIPF